MIDLIVVKPAKIKGKAGELDSCVRALNSQKNTFNDINEEVRNVWHGDDSVNFFEQINGQFDNFDKIKMTLREYVDFLEEDVPKAYKTLDEAYSEIPI